MNRIHALPKQPQGITRLIESQPPIRAPRHYRHIASLLDQQGATRLERGRSAFKAGEALARRRGWVFGWRLIELPGVGHNARKMFSTREAVDALRP